MSADILQTIKVRAGDLECSVCTNTFELENRLPMSLLCGHTFCSYCLTQITKCPTCREKIEQKPQKNTMVCSMIEAHSSTFSKKTCSLHLQPCNVFCPKKKEFVCAECFIENDKGISTLTSINAKAQKIQEKRDEINKKRQSAIDSLEELLLQDKNNSEQTVSDAFDEELARVFSVRKKQKKEFETSYYSKKERYEHELLATDLVKYLKNNEMKLTNWQEHQDPMTATEIIETDLEAGKEMEDFDKKVNELKTTFQAGPRIKENCEKAEETYLCQTFEEYGFTVTYKEDKDSFFNVFSLETSQMKPLLKKFYPEYFDCTLQQLDLKCFNDRSFNFGIVCDILENIVSLAYINLEFVEPALSEFELLQNFILRSKGLRNLSINFPVMERSISCFPQFLMTLLSLNKTSKIIVSSLDKILTSQMFFEPLPCSLKCCQVQAYDDGDDCSTMFRESFEAISKLLKSTPLERFKFDFDTCAEDPSTLQNFCCFLENLPNLLYLKLRIANPSLLKNNLLNRLIFEGIMKHSHLKTLKLFVPAKSKESYPAFAELCGQLGNTEYLNNNLQELNLTFYNFKKINLQKILIFISCFCQIKILKLRFYLVKKDLAVISEFFKGIHELKGLEKFIFEFFTPKGLTSNQLQELQALLPSSLTESTVVFEKLSSETAGQCHVWLGEDAVRHDEDE